MSKPIQTVAISRDPAEPARPSRGWARLSWSCSLALCRAAYVARQEPRSRTRSLFVQNVIDGLKLGFVYALIALGYTMVYGIVKLINFAHGDVFMVGAFTSYYAVTRFSLHQWPQTLFPAIPAGPLRRDRLGHGHPALDGRLHAAGGHHRAGGLQAAARRAAHRRPDHGHRRLVLPRVLRRPALRVLSPVHPLQEPLRRRGLVRPGRHPPDPPGVETRRQQRSPSPTSSSSSWPPPSSCSSLLQFIVRRTKIGVAMRATSFDKPTARLMGINVDRVISFTFAIGAAFAGLGGVLYAIAYSLDLDPAGHHARPQGLRRRRCSAASAASPAPSSAP